MVWKADSDLAKLCHPRPSACCPEQEHLYFSRQVRPIFVDEPEEIVVVTVYVYYF
jgi:hypothetical protein